MNDETKSTLKREMNRLIEIIEITQNAYRKYKELRQQQHNQEELINNFLSEKGIENKTFLVNGFKVKSYSRTQYQSITLNSINQSLHNSILNISDEDKKAILNSIRDNRTRKKVDVFTVEKI